MLDMMAAQGKKVAEGEGLTRTSKHVLEVHERNSHFDVPEFMKHMSAES